MSGECEALSQHRSGTAGIARLCLLATILAGVSTVSHAANGFLEYRSPSSEAGLAFAASYPDWPAWSTEDPRNLLALRDSATQCTLRLNGVAAPLDKYRLAVERYAVREGARVIRQVPLEYETAAANERGPGLTRTRGVQCGEMSYLFIASCPRKSFPDATIKRVFDSMSCADATESRPADGSSIQPRETATSSTQPSVPGGNRPALGMVITPAGAWSGKSIKAAYQLARRTGVRLGRYYVLWPQIEPSVGQYDWAANDSNMAAVRAAGLRLSVTFTVIRSAILGPLPAGMDFRGWEDAVFAERFEALVTQFVNRYSDVIDYVEIGAEVNIYLRDHRDELIPFRNFYQRAYQAIKSHFPSVKVGTVFAFHEFHSPDELEIYHQLAIGDLDGFTVYALDRKQEFSQDPASQLELMKAIEDLTGTRPFAIEETGWSASPNLRGSPEDQRKAVGYFFDFLERAPPRMLFASWFTMHDGVQAECERIARSFLAPGSPLLRNPRTMSKLSDFFCQFGLRENNGSPRPGWNEYAERASRLK